ncbi:MAG TPA: DUF4360 domain-containing protein [Oligoflexus sp.]|uniref:DUF4360 domain-containing protein n=1 Tax=Oligoflexus sp. TaxID=1971216 RepID=UPI002D221082|nr:DUF4360 domain-containing protein [Oligoflexus sp.]HYX37496.1 DUF4360 domain-containing protein [Oligoflexus sp.]
MSMVGNLAKVLAPAALLVSSVSFADGLVPAEPVTIKSIQVNGTGCPLGTVAQNISEDNQAFTLTFSEFVAETGPGLSPTSSRKNCVVTATLKVPVGWQYSIGSFFYRGYMGLDEGIRATHSTSYFFEGQGKTGTFASVKEGPLAQDFVFTDKIGLSSAIMPDTWSECTKERALNINTSIRVSNVNANSYPNAQGLITNDSIDGEIKQVFGLTWRRCP